MKINIILTLIILLIGCDSKEAKEKSFYTNGYVKNKDNYLECKNDNWCYIYGQNKRLLSKYQIFKLKKAKVLNQSIVYDLEGKIDLSRSSFYEINCPDTLFVGNNKINVTYCPYFKDKENWLFFCVGKKLNSDFSNKNNVELDTFTSSNSKYFISVDFKKEGLDTIRGFITEEVLRSNPKTNSYEELSHTKLFEKAVYVKDTVN